MSHSDWAWLTLAAAIVAYETRAPRGQLLSQAVDRYRARRPVTTTAVIVYLAGHLMRVWPSRIDPLSIIGRRAGHHD